MKNVIKSPDRPSKSLRWVSPLVCFLGLTLALGAGCGLIGGGDKPKPVPTKTGAKASAPGAAKKEAAAAKKKEESLSVDKLRAEIKARAEKFKYTREGKTDPFFPLEAVMTAPTETAEGPPPEEVPPIERLSLSQFKLVAVIVGERTRAMVEDSAGTGYIIKVGTKIGNRNGRVISITASIKEEKKPAMVRIEEDKFKNSKEKREAVLALKPVEGEKK